MHVEGAYIHDRRSMYFAEESEGGYHNHWGKRYSLSLIHISKGGTEHPMILYKRFRGQEPSIDALLIRNGIKK